MYGPLVRPGGLIAIHDIVPGSEDKVGGVPAFWELLREACETREFVEDWGQGGFGIGVVVVPLQGLELDRSRLERGSPDDTGGSSASAS
jgi:hypothetical protein